MNFNKKYLILICFSCFAVCIDQWSKLYVHTHFFEGESLNVIKGFFNLTYIRNTGAAFGIFHSSTGILKDIFFFTITPVVLTIILSMIYNMDLKNYIEKIHFAALCSVTGGALGNYIDRLRLGYVIDFIDIYYKKHHWPAFNFADSFVCLGMFLLILCFFLEWKQSKMGHSSVG